MSKTYEVTYEFLEELASNNYQYPIDKSILDFDPINHLMIQIAIFSKEIGNLNVNLISTNLICDVCRKLS